MRTIRRVGGMAFAGLLLTGVVGGQAASAADTTTKSPETYLGSASGSSLHLKVGPTEISAGISNALVDSTLKAVADSSGALNVPLLNGANAGKVEVSTDNSKQAVADKCATPSLSAIPAVGPQLANVLSVGVACSSSLAEVNAGMPHALSSGSVFDLDANLQNAVSQLPLSTVQPYLDTVYGGIAGLNKAISNIVPGTDLKLTDTLSQVVTALGSTKTLTVRMGTSTSEVTTNGNTVTSTAKSDAGLIQLFPLGAVLPTATGVTLKPIVEIEIGSSSATATYDRTSGKSAPSFNPAIAVIRVNTPTTDAVTGLINGYVGSAIDLRQVTINPDLSASNLIPATIPAAIVKACSDAPNEFCILEGTPLETRLAVASGRTVQNADGSVGAVADAVKINALRRITETPVVGAQLTALEGGILLELAHAQAGVGGKPAELVTVSVPDVPRELPRTGGTPWIPMVAVAGLVIALAARRTMVKASAAR
jgi:hypothetical protein